jgi:dihydropteroate synthase
MEWHLRDRVLSLPRRPLILGIVNVTPDSFSDGGQHGSTEAAVAHALRLAEVGADMLDLGGESTRPGSMPIPLDEELRRVLPVVEQLVGRTELPLSIDTSKAQVARRCLASGAHVINDVTALTGDPDMPEVVRAAKAGAILMHMQGTPATMQLAPHYDEVVADVAAYLQERLQDLANFGIAREQCVLDPGIGFGKTREHNLHLIARLKEFQRLGRPVCLGVSRKGFLGKLLDRPIERRLAGSLAAVCFAMTQEAVQVLRVHDVAETRDVVKVFEVLWERQR